MRIPVKRHTPHQTDCRNRQKGWARDRRKDAFHNSLAFPKKNTPWHVWGCWLTLGREGWRHFPPHPLWLP